MALSLTTSTAPEKLLLGRRGETETLDQLLAAVRGGESRALVVRGDEGVGKTALLDYVVDRAAGCVVVRAAGVQSEMELAFAGLQQLCAPLLDRLPALPGPHRDALGTALGLTSGRTPDRLLVGLAVLGLLSDAAARQPLVCVIDDAQWLDRASAQALAFVARRLQAESVALVFVVRERAEERELAGLPELVVEGLGERDAQALLASVLIGPLDERVRDRIVAETRGNPLALLELPRGLSATELAGGFGFPAAAPLSGRIEDCYRRRLIELPSSTRLLLLVASAEPVGDPLLVWGGARRLGIDADAAAAAAGFAEFGARVRFRHPLVRSAVYHSASLEERQAVHAALADATDPDVDPDRRAWHLAQAATGPDEDIAWELERSAGRAQGRGGLAAAAAFLEQAAGLTLEPGLRARRALAAARAKHQAGAPDAALALLAIAEAGPLDELQRARALLLRGQIAFALSHGSDALPLLLEAARRFEPLDARLARETYLEAMTAATFAGSLASGADLDEVAQAALAAPPSPELRAADLLLDGLALLNGHGYPAGTPQLKRALQAFAGEELAPDEGIAWLSLAGHAAAMLWDDEACDLLSTRHVELARTAGALTVLPLALTARVIVHVHAGDLTAPRALIEEIDALTEVTGSQLAPYGALAVAAWRGQEAQAHALIEAAAKEVVARGEGMGLTVIQYSTAILCNGLGRYEDALAAAQQASEHVADLRYSTWALVELIEAATRTGVPDRAREALARLAETTRPSGSDWGLGVEARSRALLADGQEADALYREAIDRLARTRVRVSLARAHLVYGEWLRRERRRIDAREQLRVAHEMFQEMGLEAFTERAARELLATGETARKRTADTTDQLTAQESQIARLARDGLSNPEIASQLFISPRTVEYHLHKVFAKLNISSRNQLERVLTGERPGGQPGVLRRAISSPSPA